MVRGVYTGASGMIAQQERLDVVANNLANVDKPGFKRDTATFKAFPETVAYHQYGSSADRRTSTFPLCLD